jgi:hypothetical protein
MSSTVTFRLATDEDACYVGENLRECDRLELSRGGNEPPLTSPLKSLHASLIAWTMVREGKPIALFGVGPLKGKPGVGVVWLLGTPGVERAARALVSSGRYYVSLMARLFPTLCNAVDIENSTSRRWLRALGFHEGETILMKGNPFVVILYRRPDHV